ncbi:MAG TPA: hypothetical protein VNQ77_10040 [Frankiaceae bacterium]|nr:hypothetical protein [Frankiaceae bacterium]
MRSSFDKRRDMARSILPSTSRESAKDIARIKRAHRRRIAQHLHVGNGVPEDWDDALDAVDLRAYPDIEIRQQVQWRRSADKLNHFQRWAVRVTRDIRQEDRLSGLAATLPRGLIGDHAVSHLYDLPELDPGCGADPSSRHAYQARWAVEWAARAERKQTEYALLRARLVAAVTAYDGHRLLNRAMKAAPIGDPPRWRTLAGPYDVDAFLHDVNQWAVWWRALNRFLDGHVTPGL